MDYVGPPSHLGLASPRTGISRKGSQVEFYLFIIELQIFHTITLYPNRAVAYHPLPFLAIGHVLKEHMTLASSGKYDMLKFSFSPKKPIRDICHILKFFSLRLRMEVLLGEKCQRNYLSLSTSNLGLFCFYLLSRCWTKEENRSLLDLRISYTWPGTWVWELWNAQFSPWAFGKIAEMETESHWNISLIRKWNPEAYQRTTAQLNGFVNLRYARMGQYLEIY